LEKNAVALILVNGYRYCTGSLVNTTANDFRPLFLTADHCLGGWAQSKKYDALEDANLSHWSFYWHYESKWCSNNKPTTRSTSGAVVKANSDITDFALLQLTENPLNKSGVTPYYLGWDATGNTGGSGGVCIHHPAGDIKKIATHNITPPNSSNCMDFESGYGGYYYNSNFWRVNWRATTNGHSVTEGGSSGSPLLNSNYHVIGQLFGAGMYCANPDCSNPPADIANYGKFSVSWNWFSTIERQLKHWLDPNNTGALTHHGTFKCSGNLTVSGKTYGSSTSILEDTYCTVNISNTSYNNGAVAKYYVGNKILISPNTVINAGSNVLFVASGVIGGSKSGSNNEEFDEELSENEEMLTPPKNAIAEVKTTSPAIKLHPNPNAGTFQLETNIPLTDIANLKITNPLGATIYETQNVTSNTIQLQIYASGLHFVVVMLKDGTVLTQKMMIQR